MGWFMCLGKASHLGWPPQSNLEHLCSEVVLQHPKTIDAHIRLPGCLCHVLLHVSKPVRTPRSGDPAGVLRLLADPSPSSRPHTLKASLCIRQRTVNSKCSLQSPAMHLKHYCEKTGHSKNCVRFISQCQYTHVKPGYFICRIIPPQMKP